MDRRLTFDLHSLTRRMDRSAERLLNAEFGISYRRFMTLLILDELGTSTQRALAEQLDVTEPSLSRMAGSLAELGLLHQQQDPGGGNKRQLSLTPEGKQIVKRCHEALEQRFEDLVKRSGIPYTEYARYTRKLLDALDSPQ